MTEERLWVRFWRRLFLGKLNKQPFEGVWTFSERGLDLMVFAV